MKLAIGAVAYLAVLAAIGAAVFAGLSSIERRPLQEAPVLAMEPDDRGAVRERATEEVQGDPNRVPVWIAPTAKYHYTPQPIEPRQKSAPAIGKDARGAMAKQHREPRLEPRDVDAGPPALLRSKRQDNDPFFRD